MIASLSGSTLNCKRDTLIGMPVRPAVLFIIASALSLAVGFQISRQHTQVRVLAAQTERGREIIRLHTLQNYWLKMISDSPTYRDGYIQLAAIAHHQGENIVAREWLAKALEIDPNYELPATLAFLQPLFPQP